MDGPIRKSPFFRWPLQVQQATGELDF